ncbi:Inorganic pyrophosphatase [Phenylobacterium sp.]|uniref:Inorganic pyrophosphatase n=1 Tax=Phenylobacterium sp. TaxID=1871053 RepID=UPI0035B30722
MSRDRAFWEALDRLAEGARLVLDRPRGSRHPRFPNIVYPLDYGYLEGTQAADGGGVDVWRGSLAEPRVCGAVATVDLLKRDTELKLLIGCTAEERAAALAFHNDGGPMKALMMERPD